MSTSFVCLFVYLFVYLFVCLFATLLACSFRSPVKKKTLIQDERVLTPKQRVDLRKKQRADQEAEKIKQAAAKNYNEARKRFREHRKKQVRIRSSVNDLGGGGRFSAINSLFCCCSWLADKSSSPLGGGASRCLQ